MREPDGIQGAGNDGTASGPNRQRLESWKEIAAYLNRGVTTVQRWEQEEGLPVHRLPHAKKGSVFAFSDELDDWLRSRAVAGGGRSETMGSSPVGGGDATAHHPGKLRRRLAVGGLLVAATIAGALALAPTAPDEAPPDAMPIPRPLANEMGGESSRACRRMVRDVVYDWTVGGTHGLYVKPVSGGPPRALVLDEGIRIKDSGRPSWSPKGDLIAFLADDGPQRYALHVVPGSGGHARRLTSMAGIGLCWYPDGSQLGFIDRTAAGEPFSVFSISLATGERRRVTYPPPSAFGDTYCSISRDARLAIVRHATRNASDLYLTPLASAANGSLHRLTFDRPAMRGLAWTLDGTSIVIGSPNGLWRVPVTDLPAEPALITGIEHAALLPSLSRSDREGRMRLATNSGSRTSTSGGSTELPDGAERSRLLPGSTLWEDFPALSPGGERIAFVSNRTGEIGIWTAFADGSRARQLTFHRGVAVAPQWPPTALGSPSSCKARATGMSTSSVRTARGLRG